MSKYDVIAFDLDGTLTDPAPGLTRGFEYCFKKLGLPYSSREGLRKYIGPSLFELWQEDFGLTPDESNDAIMVFREYYNIYGWWDNSPYDGIHEVLQGLKNAGKTLVLATSKPIETARSVLKLFKLTDYFDYVGGAYSHKRDKKCEVLQDSLIAVGVDINDKAALARCILVGDRCYDAEGAKIVGIDSMGVFYGHGTYEEIMSSGFTLTAATVGDVLKMLK